MKLLIIKQNSVIFVGEILKKTMLKMKNIAKLGTNIVIQMNIEVLHIAYIT